MDSTHEGEEQVHGLQNQKLQSCGGQGEEDRGTLCGDGGTQGEGKGVCTLCGEGGTQCCVEI